MKEKYIKPDSAIQFAFVGEHIHWNHVFKFFLHGIAGNTGH